MSKFSILTNGVRTLRATQSWTPSISELRCVRSAAPLTHLRWIATPRAADSCAKCGGRVLRELWISTCCTADNYVARRLLNALQISAPRAAHLCFASAASRIGSFEAGRQAGKLLKLPWISCESPMDPWWISCESPSNLTGIPCEASVNPL